MADSYHIIDGKVIPFSGGRKCNDTGAWRDATPLELQLQEQLEEYENTIAAQSAEIDALRAEVERWKRINAEQVKLHVKAEIRAERLAEALEMCLEMEERPKVIELAKAALATLSKENSND